jgi:DNA mismatch repair ATPase MutS
MRRRCWSRRRRYRPGYNEELDEWRALADGATDYLDKLEIRERERLGLDTLKVGYNAVHGYYIQISRGQSHLRRSLRASPDAEKRRTLHYS